LKGYPKSVSENIGTQAQNVMTPIKVMTGGQLQIESKTSKLNSLVKIGHRELNWFLEKEDTKLGESILRSIEDHNLSLDKVDHKLRKLTKED
jgi:hypothetical protein